MIYGFFLITYLLKKICCYLLQHLFFKLLVSFQKQFHITNLVFIIAPRVNAAGRMDDARKAVMMFIADSYEEAMHWAEQLNADNTTRKEADSNITEEALALIQGDEALNAWHEWCACTNIEHLDSGSARLLPLLAHNLQKHGVSSSHLKRYQSISRYAWVRNQLLLGCDVR